MRLTYLLFAILLMVTACKKDNENPGQPPTVSAGPDLTGTVGSTVSLNGTATDPDGDQLTISWSIVSAPAGSSAAISNPSSLTTSFIPDLAGPYTIRLSVSDSNHDPVTDEVIVTVAENVGEPPVAAITDKDGRQISADNQNNTVALGTSYILSAGNSTDPDGDELTYQWEVTSAPENADYSLTESADKKQVTLAPKTVGDYKIKVTVTDPKANSATAEVTLTATAESVLITANVDADTTWIDLFADPNMPDYIVKNDISVNAALTIAPGVVVQLDEDVVITVATGGTFIAEGTQDKMITFTSSDEAGQIYWGGLLFESSSANNSLNYVTVKFGGGDDFIIYASSVNDYIKTNIAISENGKLKIANSQITYSEGDGLVVVGKGNLAQLEGNTFANNTGYAMSISVNQAGAIATSNVFEDNGDTQKRENIVRVFDSSMDTDQEWFALSGDASYIFTGKTSIDASLTIQEGAKLEFDEGVTLTVGANGALVAKGTADKKIVFTGAKIAEGQNWGGILFKSSSVNNELDYVSISYAGNDPYLVYDLGDYRPSNLALDQNAKVKLTNTEIANSAGYGLFVHSKGVFTAFGNNNFHDNANYPLFIPASQVGMVDNASTFTANQDNVVAILKSTFDSNASFADDANPKWIALNGEARYLITDELTIDDDLVVAPGAYFMVNENIVMNVTTNGSLKAIGTADSLIVITAYNEDSNNNWGGISIKSDNGNEIQYAKISFAGNYDYLLYTSGDYRKANIAVDQHSTLELHNTTVTNSKGYGLAVHSTSSVNGLTGTDTDPAASVEAENTFSDNASGNIYFGI